MPNGPNAPQDALPWIKEAARSGRLVVTRHLLDRCARRHFTIDEVAFVVRHAYRVEPYSAPSQHGGTSWRVYGKDSTGRAVAVGVEAYQDDAGRAAVVCTIFPTGDRR